MKRNNLFTINEPNDTFEIHENQRAVSPILWNRNGEFRIIPTPILQNIVDLLVMFRATMGNVTYPKVVIMWSQGIPISNLAGRALVGE
jgi:hypothetical protein